MTIKTIKTSYVETGGNSCILYGAGCW